jgi:hypothetical protein
MTDYVFIVSGTHIDTRTINVTCDESLPLMEVFNKVAATHSIPMSVPDANGGKVEVEWTFSWGGDSSDNSANEMLSQMEGLMEQGVPSFATITAFGNSIAGGSNAAILAVHRRVFFEFVDGQGGHLAVIGRRMPREWVVRVSGVRAITGLDGGGQAEFSDVHDLQMLIPIDYPYDEPVLKPLSDIFHPNVSRDKFCLFVNSPMGVRNPLAKLLAQALEIMQYRQWNLEGENGRMNARACDWVKSGGVRPYLPIRPVVRLVTEDAEVVR